MHSDQSQYSERKAMQHAVHESAALGNSLVGHIPSIENVADLVTKVFYGKRRKYWSVIFFMIFMMTISSNDQFMAGHNQISLTPLVIV